MFGIWKSNIPRIRHVWTMLFCVLHIIGMSSGVHGRGYDVEKSNEATDCLHHYNSHYSKAGSISSPHYPGPYSSNQRCKYVFHGHGHERVQIKFTDIDLNYDQMPSHTQSCDPAMHDTVIVTTKIQNRMREIGRYCHNTPYHQLMSSGNKLQVHFISHDRDSSLAKGFNATYRFVTDFGIKTGVRSPDKACAFHFHSDQYPNGTFTSPNYPGIYPRNTECTYTFLGEDSEAVYITFPFFDIEGMPPKCDVSTRSDYVDFSNFDIPDRKMRRFCGEKERTIKKYVKSDGTFFRVIFKSNDIYDALGFRGVFQFRRPPGAEELLPIPSALQNAATVQETTVFSGIQYTHLYYVVIIAYVAS